MSRRSRYLRILTLILLGILALLVSVSWLWLESASFDRWLRTRIVTALEERFPVFVTLDRAHLEVLGGTVEIENFRLQSRIHSVDIPAIEIAKARLNFSLLRILSEGLHLDELFVSQPKIHIAEDPNGRLNIENIFLRPDSEPAEDRLDGSGFPWTVQIGRVQVKNGMLAYMNERVVFDSQDGALAFSLQRKPESQAYAGDLKLSGFVSSIDHFTLPVSEVRTRFTLTEGPIEFHLLELNGPAVDARLVGTVEDLKAPKYNFELNLEVNLADLEIFHVADQVEQGSVQIAGHLDGLLAEPVLSGTVISPLVQVKELPFKNLDGEFSLDRMGISLPQFTFDLFDGSGSVKGQGHWSRDRSSEFRVQITGVDLSSLLSYANQEGVSLAGSTDTTLTVVWPGMSLAEIEMNGGVNYRGAVIEQGLSGIVPFRSPLHFEGSGEVYYGNGSLKLSTGHLTTEKTIIDFSAWIVGTGTTEFSATITSQSAQELIDVGASLGLPWKEFHQRFDIDLSGRVRAEVDIKSPSTGTTTLDAQLRIQRVEMGSQLLGSISGEFHLADNQIRIEAVELTNPEFELTGSAWLDRSSPTERFSIRTRLSKFPAEVLFNTLQIDPYFSGLVSGQFALARDESSELSGDGNIRLTSIEVPGLPAGTIEGLSTRFNIRNGTLQLQDTTISSPAGELRGFLDYALGSGSFSTRFDGAELALGELPLLASVPIQGSLNLSILGEGNIDNPEISVTGDSEVLYIAEYPLQDFQLSCLPEVGLNRFRIGGMFLDQPFQLAGTVEPVTPFPFKAQLVLKGTPLSPYLALLTETEVSGVEAFLTGLIEAEGTLKEFSQLQLRGDLQKLRLMLRDYELTTAEPVTMTLTDGSIQVPSLRFTGEETDLRVGGQIDLKEQGSVNLKLVGNSSLRLLNAVLEKSSVEGRLELEIDISGPLDSPQIVGTANLSRGRYVHSELPLTFWNIQGSLKFTPAQLSLERLVADTELGRINLDGGVFLESFVPQRWQIRAVGTGLQVEYPADVISTLDMNLSLVKSPGTQLISGAIYLRSSEFTKNITLADLILQLAQPAATRQRQPQGEEIALDISVTGHRSMRIDNNLGDVTASADLSMIGTVANPVILGSITIDEGALHLEGNDFDISRGTISFNDPYKTSPYFNFEAETTIREYEITASVRGPMDRIKASFSSDPPLSTTGVISLLATGQTSEEIFGTGTTGQTESGTLALYGAGALLSKTLGSELQSQTSKLFGLQRFSVDPFIDSGRNRDPGARITLGAQLSKNVNVTYISSLGKEILGQTVVIQYRLSNWLTLVGTSDSEGSLAIDIKFKNRF